MAKKMVETLEENVKETKKDGMGPYDPNDVFFVVQGEMEYGNSLGQVD